MPKEMTIGSAAAAGIRWENWNDFRARALASVIADYLGRWTQNVKKKQTRIARIDTNKNHTHLN